jgi:transglutaminase-like putative cysteine protease
MKKLVLTLMLVLLVATMFVTTSYANSQLIKVNTNDSTVSVNYNATDYSKIKVAIAKGSSVYYYDLPSEHEVYPLQMGNGTYSVNLYENVSGNKYKSVYSKKISLKTSEESVFLSSSQNVSWDEESAAVTLASELTEGLESDEEKFQVIYDYVVKNIRYDYRKAYTVQAGYIPSPDDTLVDGTGICYDYSSLLAVMLRSQDIPTKLVKGYSTKVSVYHAWNEVFINGQWSTVDTTVDASSVELTSAFKAATDYDVEKIY